MLSGLEEASRHHISKQKANPVRSPGAVLQERMVTAEDRDCHGFTGQTLSPLRYELNSVYYVSLYNFFYGINISDH